MKETIKKLLRNYCPNIPALRRAMSNRKLAEINRYIMPAKDIERGESSLEAQREIVGKYSGQWPEKARRLNRSLDEYIERCEKVRNRDDLDVLRDKVLFACLAYGFQPDEFFAFGLEGKNMDERRRYISDSELKDFVYRMNDIIDVDVFFDKFKTYAKFKKYYRREAVSIEKQSDYERFLAFIKRHPVFVQKNVVLSKGDSVALVDSETCGKTPRQLFDEMLAQGKYIVEERVQQSSALSRFNASSVNTVRIISFNVNGRIVIGPCFFKTGKNQSFVDNAGQGGIVSGIVPETGVIGTIGYDEFTNAYVEHPETGMRFEGSQMPDWDGACAMVTEMSRQVPGVKYIGWDLAYTDEGWVVIEGNGSSQIIIPQIVWRRGFRKDVESITGIKVRDYAGE